MNIFMKNNDIQIVYTKKRDIPFVMEAEQYHENAEYIGQWSLQQHFNALNDEDILHLIVKNMNEQPVGYAILRGITNPNDSIELMRIVITEKSLGYGKGVVALIKEWCFDINCSHRLWLDVREDNIRARHVYEMQGFKCEGILRECIKMDNSYKSLVIMSVLADEYHTK